MQTQKSKYCITSSQLDAFQNLLDSEMLWSEFWGASEDPVCTHEDFALECEKKLIDQLNRCPKEPIEAADKGSCINEIVDCFVHHRKPQNGVSAKTVNFNGLRFVVGSLNGFIWLFDHTLLQSLLGRYQGSITQYRCEAVLHTSKADVTLYGYPDYWFGNKVYDLKTTSQYQFGKFARKWQRHVYPFCLVESGDCTEISEFEYTAVKLSNETKTCPIITGEIYPEVYSYDHEQSRLALTDICERFIDWLESRRELVTDKRIFGGENAADYIGTPIEIEKLK